MKIVDEGKTIVRFDQIEQGGVFRYGSVIYMRTEPITIIDDDGCEELMRAVSLNQGVITDFTDDEFVQTYPDAKLVYH